MEQKLILIILFIISPCFTHSVKHENGVIFDIRKYGARPNSDISQALTKAWKEAIASPKASKIYIPRGIWMLSQVKLSGPNKAPILLQVEGTVKAYSEVHKLPDKRAEWITFGHIDHFTLAGGVFDGSGQAAWKSNDCKKNRNCIKLPINLSFNFMDNSIIQDTTTKDSKNFHVKCLACNNVTFQRLTVSAPGDSPNTDGIHLSHSSRVDILGARIETGDDCISMNSDMSHVRIRDITCGPGHGISVGSLGGNAAEKDVSGIYVTNCTFIRTQNGVRVKTWPSGPATLEVSDLRFEDLVMIEASNPVIIDQEYCPSNLCDRTKPSSIKVRKVSIKNIRGTTAKAEAITLNCSKTKPCEDVEIGDVDLKYVGKNGRITTKCANVKPRFVGRQNPPVCASHFHHHSSFLGAHHHSS
ncbi:polygalacturonase-like [Salvia miltiorrhiza]|uniref:polygalacturonase-like n=1 Tax=Salvia miltiorrhiza TaxID=226208 RepID=UPI0025AC2FAC|nr:polygalacturonase-like [Salvia miltiorrhiza]